jgi:predicted transglutaminase-like cysteine proteinase
MSIKTVFALLATFPIFLLDAPAQAQTVVGADSGFAKYNRLRTTAARPAVAVPASAPNLFGTTAIAAGVTFYDARFRRVSDKDRDHPLVREIATLLAGLSPEAQLAAAQSEVLKRVRWTHDLENMRVADFWSEAGETLERGTGDSEDIAIATMQVLKAAGWAPRDLYLSIGRSRKSGAHVVLVARSGDQFMLLDDKVGHPLRASAGQDFSPVLTVGWGKSWVHGRRIGGLGGRLGAR